MNKGDYVISVTWQTTECVLSIYKPHQSGADAFNVAEFSLGSQTNCSYLYSYEDTLVIRYEDSGATKYQQVIYNNVDSDCVVG